MTIWDWDEASRELCFKVKRVQHPWQWCCTAEIDLVSLDDRMSLREIVGDMNHRIAAHIHIRRRLSPPESTQTMCLHKHMHLLWYKLALEEFLQRPCKECIKDQANNAHVSWRYWSHKAIQSNEAQLALFFLKKIVMRTWEGRKFCIRLRQYCEATKGPFPARIYKINVSRTPCNHNWTTCLNWQISDTWPTELRSCIVWNATRKASIVTYTRKQHLSRFYLA